MVRVLKKNVFFEILLCFAVFFCYSESFRVRKVHSVFLPGNSVEEQNAVLGINDSLAVFMPDDMTYIEGFELKIQIPAVIADWRDSVAFSIYDGIKPKPNSSQIDYSGTRIFVTPLPAKLNWIVQIPLKEHNFGKDSSYITKLNVMPDVSNGFAFMRFQPAMKGVPDETYEAELKVVLKPILLNKGTLLLKVFTPDSRKGNYEILVDNEPVLLKDGRTLLDAGKHNICIQSEEYRSEVRTVYIDQAKTSEVQVNLKSLAPTLTVTAPENSEVFLDDEKISELGKEFVVEEGEHVIKCQIGGYEMVRALNIEKGKSYFANLTVDLEISEE